MSISERSSHARLFVFLLALVAIVLAPGTVCADEPDADSAASIETLVSVFNLVADNQRNEAGEALRGLFSEGFLRDVGTQSILTTVRRIATEHGAVQAVTATPEPHEYELLFDNGMVMAVVLHIEYEGQDDSERIAGIQLGNPRSLEQLLQSRVERLALIHRDTTVFVAPFGGEPLFDLTGHNDAEITDRDSLSAGDTRLTGQSVVMYPGQDLQDLRLILRLVAGVVDRRIELSSVVRLNASLLAEEGPLSDKAPGTPYTLYSLGEYLLFDQDVTAQRHLEAALRSQGGRASSEINWSHHSLYELLERSTVLGGQSYSPIEYLLHSWFFVEASGADAAALTLVPGRDGATYYVAVSQHDLHHEPDPEQLRRDIALLSVPLRLMP